MYAQELLIQSAETTYEQQPHTEAKTPIIEPFPTKPYRELDTALNNIFLEQSEQTQLSRLKKLLGESAKNLKESELKTILSDFQFLIDAWLDSYEKRIFGGKTLQNLLKGEQL